MEGTQEEYNCMEEFYDWDTDAIVNMFPEGQRSWSQVKKRWRVLKKSTTVWRKSMTGTRKPS